MPFSFKLSTVSLKLTSTEMKLIPKLWALSLDILYTGCKGLSFSHLPKMKNTFDSSSKIENTIDSSSTCFYVSKQLAIAMGDKIKLLLLLLLKENSELN